MELVGDDVVEATVRVRSTSTVGAEGFGETDAGAGGQPFLGVGLFGLIARPAPRDQADVIAEAARAAAAADVSVVVVGLTEEQETESVDKHTLRLPGAQDDLVRAVAAVAKKTVVVVNAATPVIMPWLDEVDAVLWAGLPGQEGGHSTARARSSAIAATRRALRRSRRSGLGTVSATPRGNTTSRRWNTDTGHQWSRSA